MLSRGAHCAQFDDCQARWTRILPMKKHSQVEPIHIPSSHSLHHSCFRDACKHICINYPAGQPRLIQQSYQRSSSASPSSPSPSSQHAARPSLQLKERTSEAERITSFGISHSLFTCSPCRKEHLRPATAAQSSLKWSVIPIDTQ